MNKTKKILSFFTVMTLFLLFSVSPVLAEEAAGSVDESPGMDEAVVETVVDIPSADEEAVETVVDIPSADEEVVETVVDIPSADDEAVETVVDIPSADEEVVETVVDIPSADEGPEYLDSGVLNVIVPISISVTIDPLELSGKGQVYSNTYKIKNNGDTDVLLTFTDIEVTFADDTSIEASPHPFVETLGTDLKAIYMMLDFERDDVPPAVITDLSTMSAISIPLSASQNDMTDDSLVQFNFSGNVNEASALDWHDNDVQITLNYTLEVVLPPVENIPLTTEAAIEIPVAEATPPAEELTPPAEELTPPADEATPPADEATPPADEATPPADDSPPESASSEPPAPSAPPESPGEPSI